MYALVSTQASVMLHGLGQERGLWACGTKLRPAFTGMAAAWGDPAIRGRVAYSNSLADKGDSATVCVRDH